MEPLNDPSDGSCEKERACSDLSYIFFSCLKNNFLALNERVYGLPKKSSFHDDGGTKSVSKWNAQEEFRYKYEFIEFDSFDPLPVNGFHSAFKFVNDLNRVYPIIDLAYNFFNKDPFAAKLIETITSFLRVHKHQNMDL